MMKNLENDLKGLGSESSTNDIDGSVYQQGSEKDGATSQEYNGIRLLDENPFRGGTSIRYWM